MEYLMDALATQLQRETNAPSKTEAVRTALLHELERNRARKPLRERICRSSSSGSCIGTIRSQLRHEGVYGRGVGRLMFVGA
ncbi:type II toxin-antitoxin system VapB family antitoxin [Mesorhizobium sp. AR07]|uniref:type II toxin-antitoxin system VapB family antitoxin n=1 Tax=Mesorhizobium sp. AR07 TaxID=2865838 RepID=UPI0029E7D7EF|nr:type II toxin-antitoxin system VapB family antitoxin [Mesorhizobium sp. AR07]